MLFVVLVYCYYYSHLVIVIIACDHYSLLISSPPSTSKFMESPTFGRWYNAKKKQAVAELFWKHAETLAFFDLLSLYQHSPERVCIKKLTKISSQHATKKSNTYSLFIITGNCCLLFSNPSSPRRCPHFRRRSQKKPPKTTRNHLFSDFSTNERKNCPSSKRILFFSKHNQFQLTNIPPPRLFLFLPFCFLQTHRHLKPFLPDFQPSDEEGSSHAFERAIHRYFFTTQFYLLSFFFFLERNLCFIILQVGLRN